MFAEESNISNYKVLYTHEISLLDTYLSSKDAIILMDESKNCIAIFTRVKNNNNLIRVLINLNLICDVEENILNLDFFMATAKFLIIETSKYCIYYKSFMSTTCKICHQQYLPLLSSISSIINEESLVKCRRHSQYFVCRKHPAELRCSINGAGDGLGYYGNGKEGYAAEFWDCCGKEDSKALGCVLSFHEPYS